MASVLIVLEDPPMLLPGSVWSTDSHASNHPDLDVLLNGGAMFLLAPGPSKSLWLVAVVELPRKRRSGWIGVANAVPMQDVTETLAAVRLGVGGWKNLLGLRSPQVRALTVSQSFQLRRAAGASAPDAARDPLDVFDLPDVREARAEDPHPLAGLEMFPWKVIATKRGGGARLQGLVRSISEGDPWPSADEGPDMDVCVATPAMAYVAPFLMELLPSLADKEWTFTVLLALDDFFRTPIRYVTEESFGTKLGPAVVDDPNVARDLERSTRHAIESRAHILYDLLDAADEGVRYETFGVLTSLAEVEPAHLSRMRAHVAREPSPFFASIILNSLMDRLEREGDPTTEVFLDDLVKHGARCAPEAARYLLTRALARGEGAHVRSSWLEALARGQAAGRSLYLADLLTQLALVTPADRLLNALTPALTSGDDAAGVWEVVKGLVVVAFAHRLPETPADPTRPFVTRDEKTGALAVGGTPEHVHDDPLFDASDLGDFRKPEDFDPDLEDPGFLARASNLAAPLTAASLDERERGVLRALVGCDLAWRVDSDYLSIFGLPNSRKELAALLAE